MRIGLLLHEYLMPNSGSAGSTLSLGKEYCLLGHDVQYFSYDNLPSKLPINVKDMLFPEYSAAYIHKLFRDGHHLDVVDGSTGDLWVWLKFFKKSRKNTLFVTRSHGLDHLDHLQILEDARCGQLSLSWKYPLYRGSVQLWEVKSSLEHADLNFMLNQVEAAYVIKNFEVSPNKVHVFPNGIPQSFLNLPFEETSFQEDSVIKIAQIGTYIQRKGINYSTPALNSILQRYPRVEVSLIGTELRGYGTEEIVYADFEPSVRHRVKVIPFFQHETLPSLLRGHHIKLFPTLAEGFGKALIEAMACGLAAITTPTPGPSDIVTDGHDALVIPIRDTQAIESALERLIVDRTLLNQLRTNAYATAQRYSWRTIAQARLGIYEKALAAKRLN